MTDHPSILPRNATKAERALERATARLADVDVRIDTLWQPETIPAELLPWLAWTLGVTDWRSDWSQSVKRDVVASAIAVHRRRGTIGAVRRALQSVGVTSEIREWFETGDSVHTFRVDVLAHKDYQPGSDPVLTPERIDELHVVVDNAKAKRSHFFARLVAPYDSELVLAAGSHSLTVSRCNATLPSKTVTTDSATAGIIAASHNLTVSRRNATLPSKTVTTDSATAGIIAASQIHSIARFTMEAVT